MSFDQKAFRGGNKYVCKSLRKSRVEDFCDTNVLLFITILHISQNQMKE